MVMGSQIPNVKIQMSNEIQNPNVKSPMTAVLSSRSYFVTVHRRVTEDAEGLFFYLAGRRQPGKNTSLRQNNWRKPTQRSQRLCGEIQIILSDMAELIQKL